MQFWLDVSKFLESTVVLFLELKKTKIPMHLFSLFYWLSISHNIKYPLDIMFKHIYAKQYRCLALFAIVFMYTSHTHLAFSSTYALKKNQMVLHISNTL